MFTHQIEIFIGNVRIVESQLPVIAHCCFASKVVAMEMEDTNNNTKLILFVL